MPDLSPWTRLSREIVYSSFLTVARDRVRLPTGAEIVYDSIVQGDTAAVLLRFPTDRYLLLRQFRYVIGDVALEIPMGGVNSSESPEEAARREVREETGATAGDLLLLGSIVPSNGQSPQRMHLFYGRIENIAAATPEHTELLVPVQLSRQELLDLIDAGQLTDAATLSAVLLAERQGLL